MRWLRALLAAIVFFAPLANLWCRPTIALASDTATVTITATPESGVPAPLAFTVFYISDNEVGISWTKPPGVDKTMVRGKVGAYPIDKTDGYQVYYDTAELTSDTGVSLDETAAAVHYRAWSETALAEWSTSYAEGKIEGVGMTLLAFVILALGLTVAMFIVKSGRAILGFAGAGAWILLGVYGYTRSTSLWDINYAVFWLGAGMAIVCVLIPVALREKKEADVNLLDSSEDADMRQAVEDDEKDRERFEKLYPRHRRHRSRTKLF